MDETIQLPPTRRRSSILPRRSTGPPIPDIRICGDTTSEASESQTFQLQPPKDVQGAGAESHLPSSIKELKAELDTWKNLRSERKMLKRSEKRKTTPPQISWETAHEFLSEEDIALLQNGPSLGKIHEDYDRLVKEVAFLRNKYDRVAHLISGIKQLVQSRFDTIKKDIGEYSENNLDLQAQV